jgi:AAA15 family ATPase/GTPase
MIQKVFIENFKAIHKGTDLPIQPFTVFIGNNGTGKSSIIEALWALQIAVDSDLEKAFKEWGGLDKIRNNSAGQISKKQQSSETITYLFDPFTIELTAIVDNKKYDYKVRISLEQGYYIVENEELICDCDPVFTYIRDPSKDSINVFYYDKGKKIAFPFLHDGRSLILSYKGSPSYFFKGLREFSTYILNWQFLYLNAHSMGLPVTRIDLIESKN